jgi:hypothetical protein
MSIFDQAVGIDHCEIRIELFSDDLMYPPLTKTEESKSIFMGITFSHLSIYIDSVEPETGSNARLSCERSYRETSVLNQENRTNFDA